MNLFEQATGLLLETFQYNRGNFKYDRRQRLLMEYQLANMRIEQTALWRQDVRDFIGLTPQKMEVYLLVIALELNMAATALCKARMPAGSPPWLVTIHTLSIVTSLVYLFLGLWFGLHAFVSSQAYKVRILTQLVRLPVPTWQSMEACRTYGSGFEAQSSRQMLRVPFAMGRQERMPRAAGGRAASPGPQGGREPGSPIPSPLPSPPTLPAADASQGASDPWGLERPGAEFEELQGGVNSNQVERQRHIWLAREASRFYQTYDAFCRISLSAGTNSLAVFFCFYCLSYVLTENAAPAAAVAGAFAFCILSIMIMRHDLKLSAEEYLIGSLLLFSSPALCGVVAFVSSKNQGYPGNWEYLMPIALFLKSFWFLYYIYLFRVKELQNRTWMPMAFSSVLYVDSFGWAKHQASAAWMAARSHGRGFASRFFGTSTLERAPSASCINLGAPSRPEDSFVGSTTGRTAEPSFRPTTFAGNVEDETTDRRQANAVSTGADIQHDTPGLVPWRVFFINTFLVAACWMSAAIVAAINASIGQTAFIEPTYGLPAGAVLPFSELQAEQVRTTWHMELSHPQGLACDAHGEIFATLGRLEGGRRGLLHGRLATNAVSFAPASSCGAVAEAPIQDIALHGCEGRAGRSCTALMLQLRGRSLVPCPLQSDAAVATGQNSSQGQPWEVPLGRSWLEDRGGVAEDDEEEDLFHPEELASMIGPFPCAAAGNLGAQEDCLVMGTTSRRVVQLTPAGGVGRAAPPRAWVPRRLLREDHGEVPGPGSLALLGGRYLGILHRGEGRLEVLDLQSDGRSIGTWRLPQPRQEHIGKPRRWASICAGGGAFYALEEGEAPGLWRMELLLP